MNLIDTLQKVYEHDKLIYNGYIIHEHIILVPYWQALIFS